MNKKVHLICIIWVNLFTDTRSYQLIHKHYNICMRL